MKVKKCLSTFILIMFVLININIISQKNASGIQRGRWRPKSSSPTQAQAEEYRNITGRYGNKRERRKYADILPELAKLKDRVQSIGMKILPKDANGDNVISVDFYVSPAKKINAWAEYGCIKNLKPPDKKAIGRFKRSIFRVVKIQIVATRGLIEFVKSDDELAFILGHEIAHHVKKHIKKRERIMVPIYVGSKILAPISPDMVDAYQAVGTTIGNIFNRDQEREADRFGLYYMNRAGYDLKAAYDFWKRMIIENPSVKIPFLSTHPSHDERLSNMKELIASIQNTQPAVNDKQAIGNRPVFVKQNSQLYHNDNCLVIQNENKVDLIKFESISDAKNAGGKPCKLCQLESDNITSN